MVNYAQPQNVPMFFLQIFAELTILKMSDHFFLIFFNLNLQKQKLRSKYKLCKFLISKNSQKYYKNHQT